MLPAMLPYSRDYARGLFNQRKLRGSSLYRNRKSGVRGNPCELSDFCQMITFLFFSNSDKMLLKPKVKDAVGTVTRFGRK